MYDFVRKISIAHNLKFTHYFPQKIGNITQKIRQISESLSKLEEGSSTGVGSSGQPTSEEQMRVLKHVQNLLENSLEHLRNIPRFKNSPFFFFRKKYNIYIIKYFYIKFFCFSTSELHTMHNETQMSLQEARHALKDTILQGNERIENRMNENKEESRDKMSTLRYN